MIISTGGRTDIVQYYTPWLLKRFEEGFVYVRNPLFPNKITRYELTPEKVDCVVFCSKDYRPILPHIEKITKQFHTYFHYTITAYGKDIEPRVPSIRESMETLLLLSSIVGKEKVAWRYEPVLLTEKYTIGMHLRLFRQMTQVLAGRIDRCIFGFVEMHRKINVNMPELIPLTEEDKERLAKGMGAIAAEYDMDIQTCKANGEYEAYGIHTGGCIEPNMLECANGVKLRSSKSPRVKKGCQRIELRDIGANDSCPNGCRYCYSNKNLNRAEQNHLTHDEKSPILLGNIKDTDMVQQGVQKSLMKKINNFKIY